MLDRLFDEVISGGVFKFETYPGKPFTIKDTMNIDLLPLPDGIYFYAFEFVSPIGDETVRSDMASFSVKDEKIQAVFSSETTSEFLGICIKAYFEARQKVEDGEKPEE